MKRIPLVLMTVFVVFRTSVTMAHPGHGADGGNHSLIHYVTEPVHAVTVLSVVVASVLAIIFFRSRFRGPRDVG